MGSCRPIALIAGSIMVIITMFAIWTFQQPDNVLQIDNARLLISDSGKDATSSSTWKGEVIRTYTGARKFQDSFSAEHELKKHGKDCDKWAVITTIFEPTYLMEQLGKLDDWCLVVVGDRKSPLDFKPPPGNVVYLSPSDQETLSYRLLKYTPWNHFGRKNIGYLYAIHHGAKLIYDTDDDNVLETGDIPWGMTTERIDTGLGEVTEAEISGNSFFNPYALPDFHPQLEKCEPEKKARGRCMMDEVAWPRGYPLEEIIAEPPRTRPNKSPRFPSVIQALANHDPDVDAIFRLSRNHHLEFTSSPRTVILPPGLLSPWNAQATLFSTEAFWGLMLPISVHGRVSDIWRSYITQRLMWNCGLSVAFGHAVVRQCRNAHNYLGDFVAEEPLYERAGRLGRVLLKYVPTSWKSMPAQIEELYIDLYERGVIEIGDVELSQAWLSDMVDIGYQFPSPHKKHLYTLPEVSLSGTADLDVECTSKMRKNSLCATSALDVGGGDSVYTQHAKLHKMHIKERLEALCLGDDGLPFVNMEDPKNRGPIIAKHVSTTGYGNMLIYLGTLWSVAEVSDREYRIKPVTRYGKADEEQYDHGYFDFMYSTFPGLRELRSDNDDGVIVELTPAQQSGFNPAATQESVGDLVNTLSSEKRPVLVSIQSSLLTPYHFYDKFQDLLKDKDMAETHSKFCYQKSIFAAPNPAFVPLKKERFLSCSMAKLFGDIDVSSVLYKKISEHEKKLRKTNRPVVGMHVRLGQDVFYPGRKYSGGRGKGNRDVRWGPKGENISSPFEFPWASFFECAKAQALKVFPEKNPIFFLATDWTELRSFAATSLGADNVYTLNHTVHDNLDTTLTNEQRKENDLNMALEHSLLSRSDVMIKGASSFSATASMISLLPVIYLGFPDVLGPGQAERCKRLDRLQWEDAETRRHMHADKF